MAEHDDKRDPALFSAIQKWLDARVAPRWHGYIWFVMLVFAGLGFTAAVAYGMRLILGIGQ